MPCSVVAVMFCSKGSIGSEWCPVLAHTEKGIKGRCGSLRLGYKAPLSKLSSPGALPPMPADMPVIHANPQSAILCLSLDKKDRRSIRALVWLNQTQPQNFPYLHLDLTHLKRTKSVEQKKALLLSSFQCNCASHPPIRRQPFHWFKHKLVLFKQLSSLAIAI